ncbi:MAG: RHS repeat-associated core domain-containing protein, partial [Thermincola sp.]|nr:RHS repeat-associated core domain-containing protein [Thermincola sp.]MDT3701631.1 RHS repeat-associated core domain-containing protein [Thermincola sp.]
SKENKGYRQKGKYNNKGKHLGWYKNGKISVELPGQPELQDTKVDVTYYLNDVSDQLSQVLMTYGVDGNYDAAYTYGLERINVEDIDETRPESQDPLYYLYDGLGSVRYMVKPDGNMRDHYRYDEYGKPAPGNSKLSPDGAINLNNTFGYTGEMWDEETDLLYLRARHYEPETGRFLSRDTYEGELGNPLSRNLYAYVENNPVNRIDPDGHIPIIPLLVKAGANGAADLMAQATMNYFFNPRTYGNIGKSFKNVNWWQVGRSSAEGLIPWKTPGGKIGRAAGTAIVDVLFNAKYQGSRYTAEKAMDDFAFGFITDLAGGGLGEVINKYGIKAVTKGLNRIGLGHLIKGTSKTYFNLAKQATKNPKSTEVVLGKYNQGGVSYTKVAESRGATYFQLDKWTDVVKEVGEKNIWNINESFIRQQANAKKTFILSHDPAQATGYFANEVNLLKDMGYSFIKEGSVWRALK